MRFDLLRHPYMVDPREAPPDALGELGSPQRRRLEARLMEIDTINTKRPNDHPDGDVERKG